MARVFRPLTLFAALVLLAVLWLAVGAGARAGAVPPAARAAETGVPTAGTSPFPPGAPGDLHVTGITSGSVTLAWTASTTGCCSVSGYDVTYTMAFNDVVATVALGNVTTVTLRDPIRPVTQYNFRVSAHDDLGHRSASSNSVTVITPLSDTGPDTTPPSAPTGLTVTGLSPAGAALSWSPSTDNVGVTGYNVYRFDGLYISTLLATVPGTTYTATPGRLPESFYVRARDAAGNVSIASNAVPAGSTPTSSPPSSPPPTPPSCRAGYANSSQWAGGFVADLRVTNTGPAPISGWTVTFSFGGDQRIVSAWNGTFRQSGTAVTLANLDWNRVLTPGGGASVGLLGSWTTSNAAPTAISLNGVSCALG
jgi:Cellulose binding domain/Fibronectin type III domain